MFASQAKNITAKRSCSTNWSKVASDSLSPQLILGDAAAAQGLSVEKRSKNHVRTCELKLNRKSGGRVRLGRGNKGVTLASGEQKSAFANTHAAL